MIYRICLRKFDWDFYGFKELPVYKIWSPFYILNEIYAIFDGSWWKKNVVYLPIIFNNIFWVSSTVPLCCILTCLCYQLAGYLLCGQTVLHGGPSAVVSPPPPTSLTPAVAASPPTRPTHPSPPARPTPPKKSALEAVTEPLSARSPLALSASKIVQVSYYINWCGIRLL